MTNPAHTVWLVLKRTLGAEPTYWYYISNAPVSTPLRVFVWLSGVRWAIEQGFEETKTELGMAHYELRKYPGWHHHMLTCMLAHFFLWHVKMRLGKKSPGAHGVAGEAVAGEGSAFENLLIPPDFVVHGEGAKNHRMVPLIPPYCVEVNPAQQRGRENHPWGKSISVCRLQVKRSIVRIWTTQPSIASI
jgi:hypothetical protein